MHPPQPFNPPVSVSVLALKNLTAVPFIRLTLRPTPQTLSQSHVAARAKWLEHGVGAQTAFPAAALSLLAEQLPATLTSLVRPTQGKPPSKPGRAPLSTACLWVFGASHNLHSASTLLADAFLVEEEGVWSASSPPAHTHAFTAAIHRAIALALQSQGALRVANQIVQPAVRLSYSFSVTLSAPPESRIIIRVTVKHSKARRLTDRDLARDVKSPLHVFTAPLGTSAILSPRPPAGDALTESVLTRWREAGMLPSDHSSSPDVDTTVVFVKFDNGLEVPFPRAVILTNQPATPLEVQKPEVSKMTTPLRKTSKIANLWKSRKRPRSPSPTAPIPDISVAAPPTTAKPTSNAVQPFANDAPTAQSLNAALRSLQPKGQKDTLPVMLHPLVETVFPPTSSFSAEDGSTESQELKEESTVAANPTDAKNSTSGDSNPVTAQVQKDAEAPATEQPVKSEPVAGSLTTARGLDSFQLDVDVTTTQDVFDSGHEMDMADFGALEDEFAEFFQDGMDDRIPDVGSGALANESSTPLESGNAQTSLERNTSEVESKLQMEKTSGADAKMDVDSVPQEHDMDRVQATGNASGANGELDNLSPTELVRAAFKSFASKATQNNTEIVDVRKRLNSFFEDDFTERRRLRLSTSERISKRRRLSKLYNPKSRLQLLRACSASDVLSNLTEKKTSPVSDIKVAGEELKRKSLYVPWKKIHAFSHLLRKGESVTDPVILKQASLSEIADSDEEGDSAIQEHAKKSYKSADILSLEELTSDSGNEKPLFSHITSDRQLDSEAFKIANSVAIDCASVCFVLSSDRSSHTSGSPAHNEYSYTHSSPTGIREDDPKYTSSIHLGQNAAKGLPPHPALKTQLPAVSSSPGGRSTLKREGELFNILSLIEMQLFSMNELCLFRNDLIDATDCLQMDKAPPELGTDMVSSATMRRVLLGLPRALETSQVFRPYLESLRCTKTPADNDGLRDDMPPTDSDSEELGVEVPSVLGPLSITEYMGKSAGVFPLNPPKVCIGYNKEWMETFGGALPLWEKAGLEPYSERKNVEYVAMAPKDIEQDVKVFLGDVSSVYEECSFGKHVIFPFEPVAFIANSMVESPSTDVRKSAGVLTEPEKAMTEQYQLHVKALCTKLASLTRENRKNPIASPTNIVAYVISPFKKKQKAANVALLRAISPLVNAVPGAVPSGIGSTPPIPNLPAAPWRASPSKGIVSLTVRVLPREVVDRNLAGVVDMERVNNRSLRPQLLKAISFAVFNSIRTKRVRIPSTDGEVANVLSRASLMPDDLMSPMTPDMVTESPGGASITPVSPLGNMTEEGGAHSGHIVPSSLHVGHVDQSCALSPSFLHEPAVVLAGVGKHMGQTDSRADIVLHLAYTFCEASSRFVFAWTDQRGELLDVATVPIIRTAMTSSRRKAFWGMWARGQRWRIPYVDEVHATVSRLGPLASGELSDWEWVMSKVMSSKSSLSEKIADEDISVPVVRRFPPPQQAKPEEVNDVYTEISTPATPGVAQTTSSAPGSKSAPSMDVKMPPVCSVSILSICNLETHLFLEESWDPNADRRDFAIVGRERLSRGKNVQASAVLARYEEDGIKALEVNILRHYGSAGHSEEMSDVRSPWDSLDVQSIANKIISNFHDLRYTGSSPSWPAQRWLSMYPVHIDAVRGYQSYLRLIHSNGSGFPAVGLR